MGLLDLFGKGAGHGRDELARRLGLDERDRCWWPIPRRPASSAVRSIVTGEIAAGEGYRLHRGRKLRIRRRHQGWS